MLKYVLLLQKSVLSEHVLLISIANTVVIIRGYWIQYLLSSWV